MKKLISILLCLIMVLALVACGADSGSTAATPAADQGSTTAPAASEETTTELITGQDQNVVTEQSDDEMITIAIEAEPGFIMPNSGSAGNPTSYVTKNMTQPLYDFNLETGKQFGVLAESLTWTDDLHYTIKIKDEATFANGDPVTAEDAVFSWRLGIYMAGGSATWDPEGFEVIDDKTFSVTLYDPYVNGAEPMIAKRGSVVYSKKALEAQGYTCSPDTEMQLVPDPENPHTSGPYKFKEWVPGQYIMLERNENYWDDATKGYYKYMKFVFIVDAAARAMAIESGDADVASYITTNMGASYEGSDVVTPYYLNTGEANCVIFNPEKPEWAICDEKVREALWTLIDADALNQLGNAGKGIPCETLISPVSEFYYKVDVDRTVDVEKAKALLAEAGYPDGFSLFMSNIAPYKAQGDVIKECFRLGGVDWPAELEEIPSHFGKCRADGGAFDILIRSYNGNDPVGELWNLDGRKTCTQCVGRAYYVEPEWTEILDRCYYSHDKDEQMQAMKEAQEYMVAHHLCCGFCTTVRLELVRKGLSAPRINANGTCDYFYVKPLA